MSWPRAPGTALKPTSPKSEAGKWKKKSIKNILIWVGCQGWSQEHRSQLKQLSWREKAWKSWVTSEGIKDKDKPRNNVSQSSSGKWAHSLSMQELSFRGFQCWGRQTLHQRWCIILRLLPDHWDFDGNETPVELFLKVLRSYQRARRVRYYSNCDHVIRKQFEKADGPRHQKIRNK